MRVWSAGLVPVQCECILVPQLVCLLHAVEHLTLNGWLKRCPRTQRLHLGPANGLQVASDEANVYVRSRFQRCQEVFDAR